MTTFKKTSYCLLVFLLSFWAFVQKSQALDLPPIPQQYVYDEANLLSVNQENQLNQQLQQLEARSTHQFVVAVVSSLQGTSIEDYGIQLAEKWKPGQKDKDNGVILLVAPNERKVRIEVGYGLEGILTDALASQIIQNEILPAFKSGQMDVGISNGVNAVIQAIDGKYNTASTNHAQPSKISNLMIFIIVMLPFIIFVILILFLPFFMRRSDTYTGHSYHSYDSWGSGSSSWNSGGSGFSSGGGSFGGGGSSGSW